MKEIICVFVRSGDHPAVESMIEKVQKSPYTHAALELEIAGKRRMVESKNPTFMIRNGEVYDHCEVIYRVPVQVTPEQHEDIEQMAFDLTSKLYGFNDCIQGGMRELFGFSKKEEDLLEEEKSVNCSASLCYLLRAAFSDFMAGENAESTTPEMVRKAVIARWGSDE